MKVAIVGSRRRNTLRDRKIVLDLVTRLVTESSEDRIVIVSGGCPKGADSFAEEAARVHRLDKIIFPVAKHPEIKSRHEFRERAFARNLLVAKEADVIYALVHPDRKGGTENTVQHAHRLGKKVYLVNLIGQAYLSQ